MLKTRERTGANGSERERERGPPVSLGTRVHTLTDVTSETLRQWREARGWDVPRMARELRNAAKGSGEDVAAHHGLVKMIPQWERGSRAPRERYRLLYLKIFEDMLGGLSRGTTLGTDLAVRLAEARSRAARLPGAGELRALEASALARPRKTMTPAEIRALAADAITHLHKVADTLAELSALLAEGEAREGSHDHA